MIVHANVQALSIYSHANSGPFFRGKTMIGMGTISRRRSAKVKNFNSWLMVVYMVAVQVRLR
jgi:hypothetical protein